MSEYIHHTSGRLRLKLARIRKNPARAHDIQIMARRLDGVTSAAANSVTGSVLIHYEPGRTDVHAILRAMSSAGWLSPMATAGNAGQALPPLAGKVLDSLAEKLVERSALALLGALL